MLLSQAVVVSWAGSGKVVLPRRCLDASNMWALGKIITRVSIRHQGKAALFRDTLGSAANQWMIQLCSLLVMGAR